MFHFSFIENNPYNPKTSTASLKIVSRRLGLMESSDIRSMTASKAFFSSSTTKSKTLALVSSPRAKTQASNTMILDRLLVLSEEIQYFFSASLHKGSPHLISQKLIFYFSRRKEFRTTAISSSLSPYN